MGVPFTPFLRAPSSQTARPPNVTENRRQRTTLPTRRPIPSREVQKHCDSPRSHVCPGRQMVQKNENSMNGHIKAHEDASECKKYLTRILCILQLSTHNVRDARFSVLPVQYNTVRCSECRMRGHRRRSDMCRFCVGSKCTYTCGRAQKNS